jgi:histidyl-tRNA synthetase
MALSSTEFLKQAVNTAEHFGFQTADSLKQSPECKQCTTSLPYSLTAAEKRLDDHGGLLVGGLATFCDAQLYALDKPTLLYEVRERPRTGEPTISFHIFNVPRSIAEAILIQTTRSLANDLGYGNHTVRINSLGDTDSVNRYSRELTNYLKKRLDVMPVQAREHMKEHALYALSYLIEKEHELAYRSPNPLEYLSDQSRKHFREIIEYLDMSETPYEIDPKLMGNHHCYSDALFSIDMADESDAPLTIRGGRYDEFVYRSTKNRFPAAGAVVTLQNSKIPARIPRTKLSLPSVYVVHLGFGPKIRSLLLIDTLRQAGINVHHDLASDSLSAQLRDAERRGVRYTIIIGQKEYVENTTILRDMNVRTQEYIPLDAIVKKLKRRTAAVS